MERKKVARIVKRHRLIESIDEANQIMYLNKGDKSVSLSIDNAKKLYYK
ncbi:hypothetical protein [Macrococcus armenti]|uniref:Uncharacterized protein n=1 Tax=Macrococcus armenti TaxID=2875764 RepID=A0ABY3ZWA1_9STAP|nr:hypothetical protein [Macrococcus armenti]UOB20619.1 hypothetical protein MRZ06_00615 [Macrococcus armenti]